MRGTALMLASLLGALSGCGGAQDGEKGAATPAHLAPANPQAVTKMAQAVAAAREPQGRERAIALLREAIAIDGNLWEARYNLGVVLAQSGDLASAEEQLERSFRLAEGTQEVTLALAEVQRRRGKYKDAAETLSNFVSKNPTVASASMAYVSALRDAGQVDKSMAAAKDLLAKKPGDASALAELALCHLAKGERETAALLAKQALESNPKSAVAERATGLIALGAGDDAVAFRSFQRAAQEDPRDTTARMNMATVLLRAGAYGKAAEQFRAILAANPEDDDAAVGLATALRGDSEPQRPKYEEARAVLEKVLARDPHHTAALFNLAVLNADFLKKPDAAVPLFRRFLADAPGDHKSRAEAERGLAALGAQKGPATAPASAPAAPAPAAAPKAPAAAAPAPPKPKPREESEE